MKKKLTKVKQKVTNGHTDHSGRRRTITVDTVIDATGNHEQYGQNNEGCCKPLAPGYAICEYNEAEATCYRSQRHSEKILLGLLNQDVVNSIARMCRVSLPRG